MFKVIRNFADATDRSADWPNGFYYAKNDNFPRFGKEVSEERAQALLTGDNALGERYIVKVEKEPAVEEEAKKPRKMPKKKDTEDEK